MRVHMFLPLMILLVACSEVEEDHATVFRPDNLVAWCIVPFDKMERSPEERAKMLKRLGIKKLAYDWRDKHVEEFEDEILACKKFGIEFFAFWSEHPKAFALFEKYDLHPQVWKTLPSPEAATQDKRVELAGMAMLPLVEKTQRLGCKFGLYNHGGWGGEPENLIAVVNWLRARTDAEHVGIVYNLHHGHDHISRFKSSLESMLPFLHCLNINGMNSNADPKILALGRGEHEAELMQIIFDSGYDGPIGILDHQADLDAEIALKENLEELRSIQGKLLNSR